MTELRQFYAFQEKGNILLLKNFSLTVPKNIKGCKYKKKIQKKEIAHSKKQNIHISFKSK